MKKALLPINIPIFFLTFFLGNITQHYTSYAQTTAGASISEVYSCSESGATLIAKGTGCENSVRMDGVNQFISVPPGVWFNSDFTVEGWVYARSSNNWARLMDFGNGPASDNIFITLSEGTSGQVSLRSYNGSTRSFITSPNKLPLNHGYILPVYWVELQELSISMV